MSGADKVRQCKACNTLVLRNPGFWTIAAVFSIAAILWIAFVLWAVLTVLDARSAACKKQPPAVVEAK